MITKIFQDKILVYPGDSGNLCSIRLERMYRKI